MELNPTEIPVKSQYMRPKSTRIISEPPKIITKGGSVPLREKRVFGTARNPNILSKAAPEKPAKGKPSLGLLKAAAKPPQTTRSPLLGPPIGEAKTSSEKKPIRPKKKRVSFKENEVERNEKSLDNGKIIEPQTPAKSSAVQAKVRVPTPYRSAERCSKCRFDKLETSPYWLSQIKLAEYSEKHFVSAAFFRLALECKAEPTRNMRVELKKYLSRHEYLNEEEEWRKLLITYGFMKEESSVSERDVKVGAEEDNSSVDNHDDNDLLNENKN